MYQVDYGFRRKVTTASGDKANDVVVIDLIAGILASVDDDTNEGVLITGGIWADVPKEGASSGHAWTKGLKIYVDDSNNRFTLTAASNTEAGVATEVATSAATTGTVWLNKAPDYPNK